jgi:uncharacterized BrkB/YihY/UPF0761 family membrane protein
VGAFGSRYSAFDRFQQRHRSIGFPLAVLQKYAADDQGGYHAATITYYGFFAIFPLLLVLTTVLGFSKVTRTSSRGSSIPRSASSA